MPIAPIILRGVAAFLHVLQTITSTKSAHRGGAAPPLPPTPPPVMMSIALMSVVVEGLFIGYFFLEYIVRGGRLRRFLWKLGLWALLLTPGVAMLTFDFTTQVQVDVSMSIILSTFVSSSIWVVMFDPDISRTVTLVQFGTLAASVLITAFTILGGRGEGSWDEKLAFMLRVPGIVGTFLVRLPWDGPRIARGLCWTLIWLWASRNDADEYYPPENLQWLNRTLQVNGTVLLLERTRGALA